LLQGFINDHLCVYARKRSRHMTIERISIELTNACNKGCAFCYNQSHREGETHWTAEEIVSLVSDCVLHGTRAVSLGGGEPLMFDGLWRVLDELRGKVFRSITTNGTLLVRSELFAKLIAARPDKVHVSIHHPDSAAEVRFVIDTVNALHEAGIPNGVNLLVPMGKVEAAAVAASSLRASGIDNQRIVYLPQRGGPTSPSAHEVARVAGGAFQSMTCLSGCGPSPRFCSISWDRQAAWCSYTATRRRLERLSYAALQAALDGLGLAHCGGEARVTWMKS
jgi:organic radical activating enzyme